MAQIRRTLEGQKPKDEMDSPLALLWSNSGLSSVTQLVNRVKLREKRSNAKRERETRHVYWLSKEADRRTLHSDILPKVHSQRVKRRKYTKQHMSTDIKRSTENLLLK